VSERTCFDIYFDSSGSNRITGPEDYLCQLLVDGELDVLQILVARPLHQSKTKSLSTGQQFLEHLLPNDEAYQTFNRKLVVTRLGGLPKDLENRHILDCPTRRWHHLKATLQGLPDVADMYTLVRRDPGIEMLPHTEDATRKGLGMSKRERDEEIDSLEQKLAGLLKARIEREF
jgi:hypothetical protein